MNNVYQLTKTLFYFHSLHSNVFPHLADLHVKITIQTLHRDKQLEGRAGVGCNQKGIVLVNIPYFQVIQRVKNNPKQK